MVLPFMITAHWQFLLDIATIIFVNLVLSGDNAVVIALAARTLPHSLRTRAILAGAACAVVLRVAVTFFADQLLHFVFLKLIGGITILWIALKLFSQAGADETDHRARASSFWHAIWFILIADVTMSLDNILAIAQVAHGNIVLLLLGLGISIPLVLFASGLLATCMDNYPVIIYLGAALLGKIGAEMALTDRAVTESLSLSAQARYLIEAAAAIAVMVSGKLMMARSVRVSAAPVER